MPAHLRPLPKCLRCGKAATQELYNAVNAPLGRYCDTHGKKALDDFVRRNPDQGKTWRDR